MLVWQSLMSWKILPWLQNCKQSQSAISRMKCYALLGLNSKATKLEKCPLCLCHQPFSVAEAHLCLFHLKIVSVSVGNRIFVGYTHLFVSKASWSICDIICSCTQGFNGSGHWSLGEAPSLSNSWHCSRKIKQALSSIVSLKSHPTEWQTELGNVWCLTSRFMLRPMLPIMCCHCVTV